MTVLKLTVRKNILSILQINMQAIQRKNNMAINTAQHAKLYISTLAAFLFLIAFTFVLNFPGLIAGPSKIQRSHSGTQPQKLQLSDAHGYR
ncbi:MAG: hypothetical protein IPO07_11300 [Haliscomenobacter sp.]|nr:hypothetical protein [Haliscomenobacter sp.]MBK9489301.1 hypothetical protein [Haliscomenobacter sp.]